MSLIIQNERGPWQLSLQREMRIMGVQLCKSKVARTCQLCWKHTSRYRRLCPICDRLIAPGCLPVQCWSDELNQCRDCYTLGGIMRYHRYKKQYLPYHPELNVQRIQSHVISYVDFQWGTNQHYNVCVPTQRPCVDELLC